MELVNLGSFQIARTTCKLHLTQGSSHCFSQGIFSHTGLSACLGKKWVWSYMDVICGDKFKVLIVQLLPKWVKGWIIGNSLCVQQYLHRVTFFFFFFLSATYQSLLIPANHTAGAGTSHHVRASERGCWEAACTRHFVGCHEITRDCLGPAKGICIC